MKQEHLELEDETYEELVTEYGKVCVVQVEDDKYVVRYPNRIEFDAIKKAQLNSTLQKSLSIVESTVEGMIVWPENSVIKERMEQDGGLLTLVTSQFIFYYMNRAVMEEKKR